MIPSGNSAHVFGSGPCSDEESPGRVGPTDPGGTPVATTDTAPPTPVSTLTDDEVLLRDSVREFAQAEIQPRVRAMDAEGRLDASLLPRLFELGVMGIEVPDALGGAGATFFHAVLAVEELSRVDPSIGVIVDVQNTLVVNAFLRWGTEAQQRAYLPRLAAEWVGAYALSESGSGSDAFALTTRATAEAGGFRLDGRKLWITNGGEASVFIVFATVDPAAGYKGITAFIVERDTPGFAVGHKEDKLGAAGRRS